MADITKNRLLIIEDDEDLADVLKNYFKSLGYEIEVRYDALGPLSRLRREQNNVPWDVILTDLKMPGINGLEFIHEVRTISANLPIILMTAHGGVETAVSAVKEGAYDFVMKPLNFSELAVTLERAVGHRKLTEENQALRAVIQDSKSPSGMIVKSNSMKILTDLIRRVAPSTATVLITGESGVGKEVVARAIHHSSKRADKPFVAINCAAIPETLLESELFGFAKGAFTGAVEKKLGLFEEAEGGTLFLDEIGDLGGALQAKLLRVLQERKIKRVGENQPREVDVRIIAATHKNLELEVREKRFREDLFFRFNVIPIHIPPLRDRREDILPLAEHFLKKFALSNQKTVKGFSKEAIEHLTQANWRGNVRELENAIERAVVLCQDDKITEQDLIIFRNLDSLYEPTEEVVAPPEPIVSEKTATKSLSPNSLTPIISHLAEDKLPSLEEWQLLYIQCVIERVNGVKEKARRILDIDRKTLYKKLDQYSALEETSPSGESSSTTFPN